MQRSWTRCAFGSGRRGPRGCCPFDGVYTVMGAYGQYITVLPVLDLVIAHQVAFNDEDEKRGQPIPQVQPWEYDAILQMVIAAQSF